ncbi:MAG: helix-turn-helix transcriptional regulator [Acidobacteria bacterium]|nr:helix-turn-helix transcriptional regulator [Acidobacteriota bacterium]
MTLGKKLARLRVLEGHARGLGRELTQTEVAQGVRELGGQISQSYVSQLENGARVHMTSNTRLLLARFFSVHPGHLVDDPDDAPEPMLSIKPRRQMDDDIDLWLIEASEQFRRDPELSRALVQIAKHDQSRECLILLGAIVENKILIQRLVERLTPPPATTRKRRRASDEEA